MRTILGNHDANTIAQFEDVASRAVAAALLPDGHLGYVMPIGGVAAYVGQVSPVGVGFDIGCGNMAVKTNRHVYDFDLEELADEIFANLSFGVGLSNNSEQAPVNHPLFSSASWDALRDIGAPVQQLKDRARNQLGTIGGGNHYVDVFMGDDGYAWIGVHFGSRGLGHQITSGFLALSQGEEWGTRVPEKEVLLDLGMDLGAAYIVSMKLAGWYAAAGRQWVVQQVLRLMDADVKISIENHHNFAWQEYHYGRQLVVIRKGATPAFPGMMGFIGGSMGDNAYIIEGALSEEARGMQEALMFSTVHGAGRVMGRLQAKGKWKNGNLVRPGMVTHGDMNEWLADVGVTVRGGDLDEAPQAYRRLDEVIASCGNTIDIKHTLSPVIVCMAPGNTVDPYKD